MIRLNGGATTSWMRLLEAVSARVRMRHLSAATEETYVAWIRRFIALHQRRHPRAMGERDVGAFLTALAVKDHVAASTQNQALAALQFLYNEVLGLPLGIGGDAVRAKRPNRLPEVLTRAEVQAVLKSVRGTSHLVASILNWAPCARCTHAMSRHDALSFRFRARCIGSIPLRRRSLAGSGSFPRRVW